MPYIQCVNDNELVLEGEDHTDLFSYVNIRIEHCKDYETSENCASDEDINNFWYQLPTFVLIFNGKEIDLSDLDDPIQTYYSYDTAQYFPGLPTNRVIDF